MPRKYFQAENLILRARSVHRDQLLRYIQGIQRIHAATGRILGGAGHFRDVKTGGLLVVANHIRERTADIDTNGQSGQRDLRWVVRRRVRGPKITPLLP